MKFHHRLIHPIHPSWGFYTAVWGIIFGIIIGIAFQSTLSFSFVLVLFCLLLISILIYHSNIITLVIIFLLGLIIGGFRVEGELNSKSLILPYYNQTVIISGQLSQEPDDSKGSTVIRLQHLQLSAVDSSSEPISLTGTLYITLSGNTVLERSDRVTLEGKLSEGFGNFLGKMSRPKVLSIERNDPGDIFARFKHWFSDKVKEFIPSPAVDLGLGYLMGMKSGLSEDFSEALRNVGMTYVVVASGAHLAILVGAAQKIFGKISKFAGILFSLLMIMSFVLIVGFTPSMTRAALVASLSLLAGYVGRKFTPLRIIAFVAMITLLINPSYFVDLGWQLSFASFFAILILAPRLQKHFYGGKTPPWLASMLITSLAASLICAPILIYNFGTISLLSFIANLIILPTLPYAMIGIFLTGLSSSIPLLASAIAKLTSWLLELHIWLVNFLSEKTMFIINLPSNDPRIYLLYLPIALFIAYPSLKSFTKKLLPRPSQPQTLEENSS